MAKVKSADIKSGFVMVGGQKIYVNMRFYGKNWWVSEAKGQTSSERLTYIENKLKRMQHAQQKLTSGKAVPV